MEARARASGLRSKSRETEKFAANLTIDNCQPGRAAKGAIPAFRCSILLPRATRGALAPKYRTEEVRAAKGAIPAFRSSILLLRATRGASAPKYRTEEVRRQRRDSCFSQFYSFTKGDTRSVSSEALSLIAHVKNSALSASSCSFPRCRSYSRVRFHRCLRRKKSRDFCRSSLRSRGALPPSKTPDEKSR